MFQENSFGHILASSSRQVDEFPTELPFWLEINSEINNHAVSSLYSLRSQSLSCVIYVWSAGRLIALPLRIRNGQENVARRMKNHAGNSINPSSYKLRRHSGLIHQKFLIPCQSADHRGVNRFIA